MSHTNQPITMAYRILSLAFILLLLGLGVVLTMQARADRVESDEARLTYLTEECSSLGGLWLPFTANGGYATDYRCALPCEDPR